MVVTPSNVSAIKQCFSDLAKAETSGDYDKALKTANKILRNFPGETLAFKCKLIALIRLSHFEEALTLIKKTPPAHMGECSFEKAYLHYRLNDNESALETLNKLAKNDVRCLELKAQLLYRTEQFEEAELIFRKLLKDYSDDFDDERQANLLAVIAQLRSNGKIQQRITHFDTYEQYYNGACCAIEDNNFTEALSLLNKAEVLCNQTLVEEGLTEEEIEDELSMIRIQKGFVCQKLGRNEEALKLYLRIQEINPSDKSVLATLLNNIPSVIQESNLFEARKKLKSALQIDGSKLTSRQRRTLLLNQALIHLHSNQREPCRRCLEDIRSKYGPVQESFFIEAALHLKSKDSQKALAVLNAAAVTDETLLTRIQILLDEGKLKEAIEKLNEFPAQLANRPAVLQLRIALLLATNDQNAAIDLLTTAVENAPNDDSLSIILEQAASLNIEIGNNRAAVEFLQRLYKLRPNDVRVLSQLIKAYSSFDPCRAEELLTNAFPEKNSSNMDVAALERAEWILYGERYKQKKEMKPEFTDTEIITGKLRKRKRKRKIRLPKNYDPKVPPDPERWLPRQERTAYKKRLGKKHRDRDIGRGTQGAISSQMIEITATVKSNNSPKPTPIMGSAEGPRQQRPAAQQAKKKKKKGNKW